MGDTTQWKKGRLLGVGGGGKVWYGFTQEKIEVRSINFSLSSYGTELRIGKILEGASTLLKCNSPYNNNILIKMSHGPSFLRGRNN